MKITFALVAAIAAAAMSMAGVTVRASTDDVKDAGADTLATNASATSSSDTKAWLTVARPGDKKSCATFRSYKREYGPEFDASSPEECAEMCRSPEQNKDKAKRPVCLVTPMCVCVCVCVCEPPQCVV